MGREFLVGGEPQINEPRPVLRWDRVPAAPVAHVVRFHASADRGGKAHFAAHQIGGVCDDLGMCSLSLHERDIAECYAHVKAYCYAENAMSLL